LNQSEDVDISKISQMKMKNRMDKRSNNESRGYSSMVSKTYNNRTLIEDDTVNLKNMSLSYNNQININMK